MTKKYLLLIIALVMVLPMVSCGGTVNKEKKYVDFDDMCFYVNGKEYVMGKTTLQEMIKDDVPFKMLIPDNPESNIDSKERPIGVIELNEFLEADVYFYNESDLSKSFSECYVSYISYFNWRKESQDVLKFTFPFDITKEELIAKAGEPNNLYHDVDEEGVVTDTIFYSTRGKITNKRCEYYFRFIDDVLIQIEMTYYP